MATPEMLRWVLGCVAMRGMSIHGLSVHQKSFFSDIRPVRYRRRAGVGGAQLTCDCAGQSCDVRGRRNECDSAADVLLGNFTVSGYVAQDYPRAGAGSLEWRDTECFMFGQ